MRKRWYSLTALVSILMLAIGFTTGYALHDTPNKALAAPAAVTSTPNACDAFGKDSSTYATIDFDGHTVTLTRQTVSGNPLQCEWSNSHYDVDVTIDSAAAYEGDFGTAKNAGNKVQLITDVGLTGHSFIAIRAFHYDQGNSGVVIYETSYTPSVTTPNGISSDTGNPYLITVQITWSCSDDALAPLSEQFLGEQSSMNY